MRILISGTESGLGCYLQRLLGGDSLTRRTPINSFKSQKYDAIVHCAANPKRVTSGTELAQLVDDNLILTKKLLEIRHCYFVFISTVDVYPQRSIGREDIEIDLNDIEGGYSITKLMAESLVRDHSQSHLILRPTSLLGTDMRLNNLRKMFSKNPCKLTLSADSLFNFLLHEDIGGFIRQCLNKKVEGTYNVGSLENITLGELARIHELKHVDFGDFVYRVGTIDITKAISEYPDFAKTSEEVVGHFFSNILNAEG